MHLLTSPGFWFLVVVGVWLAAGAVLKDRAPVWHWYLVGYPKTWARINWSWRPLAIERGLSNARTSGHALVGHLIVQGRDIRPVIPRVWISRPSKRGLIVRVRLLPGQVPEMYADASEAMMHAWRVHAVRVTSPQRGVVVIEALITDPLAGVVLRDTTRPILTTGPADRPVLALLAGVTERGSSWIINLRSIPHWLIVGATRSGKINLIHALVTRLAPQAVAIVGIDLKGGLELSVYGRRLSGLATTRAEAVKILSAVLEIVFDRMEECRRAAVRAVWDLPDPPPIIVIIDEVAELYLVTNSKDREETAQREQVAATLLRLAQLGGALDVHLIVGGQRFGSDLGPGATALRAQLGGRVCMHVSDPETALMVLGDLWRDAVAVAQMITPDERGTAVTSDGAGSWVRAKGTLTSPEEAADVAFVTAKLTPVLPGIDVSWNDGGGEDE